MTRARTAQREQRDDVARADALTTGSFVTVHSLTWLVAGNLVGVWLATLLLFPGLGRLTAPLTYGRWVPVHLDLQLYGWSSLPLVGLLLRLYLPADSGKQKLARLAVSVWSGALLFGAVSWLAGGSSGKLFLEWSGPARQTLFIALAFLAVVLWIGLVPEFGRARRGWVEPLRSRSSESPAECICARCSTLAFEQRDPLVKGVSFDRLHLRSVLDDCGWLGTAFALRSRSGRRVLGGKLLSIAGKATLLAALSAVPFVLFWAASPRVYPAINPESGGPTGVSLLGSALGIVALIFLYPFLAGARPDDGGQRSRWTAGLLLVHFTIFALLDHGNSSHREPVQIAALASIAIWWPILVGHLRRFPLPAVGRAWLAAFAGWAALLVASGVGAFLPGALDHLKFTNALVAHAHVAMAGMVTCLCVLILAGLDRRAAAIFNHRRRFVLWHGGSLVLAASLTVLGVLEGLHPTLLFTADPAVTALYTARWLAGAAMLVASVGWLARAVAMHTVVSRSTAVEPVPARQQHKEEALVLP